MDNMAALPRTTAYRRVRRAAESDLKLILSVSRENAMCSAEALDEASVERPAGSPELVAGAPQKHAGSPELIAEPSRLSYQQDVPTTCCFSETVPDTPEPVFGASAIHSRRGVPVDSEGLPYSREHHLERDNRRNVELDELSESEESDVSRFKEKLRRWSVEGAVPHDTVTKLLKILHSHSCFSDLPTCARALLSTPRVTDNVRPMDSGHYCHLGLSEGLRAALQPVRNIPDPIILHVNVDGLPLTKSTRDQFWPILCQAANCAGSDPFPVGVYHGQCKALQSNVFLSPFVSDLKGVLSEGVAIGNRVFRVQVGAIICDAPAKSYILGTKGHSGYFSCSKCTTEGEFVRGRMCFPDLDAPLRTNASFRRAEQEDHHIMETILKELPIDIVDQVPLDYMHLICLGVVRKLVLLWLKGDKTYRIGSASRDSVSGANIEMRHYVPSDMSRKPRSLSDIDRWKASEFRLLVLYTGPAVLRSRIPKPLMDNFMTLHCAVTILCSPLLCREHLGYAERLLRHFVETYITLYGRHAVSHNVHGLIHVASDVRVHGPLHNYSAFPFENYMRKLKSYVRKPERPLQQVYNRIVEERFLVASPAVNTGESAASTPPVSSVFLGGESFKLTARHEGRPLPLGCIGPQYKTVTFPAGITIKTNKKDCTCMLKDKSIIKVENIARTAVNYQPVLVGRRYQSLEDLYSYPCSSSLLNIFLASELSDIHFWPLSEIAVKCVRLPLANKFAVIPMVHLQ
ncbi:uncharacterized protein ISCGN_003897 [Ixodes scapularis]